MSQAYLCRSLATTARLRTVSHVFLNARHISLNSGINQGLRAESRGRGVSRGGFAKDRPSRSDSPRRETRGRRSAFAPAAQKFPRETRTRGDEDTGYAASPRESYVSRRPRETSDELDAFDTSKRSTRYREDRPDRILRSRTPRSDSREGSSGRVDTKFRSGKKPGKWERAATAAGASREDWRAVRAVRRPGTGPTERYSNPGKAWDRFKERDEADDDEHEPRRPPRRVSPAAARRRTFPREGTADFDDLDAPSREVNLTRTRSQAMRDMRGLGNPVESSRTHSSGNGRERHELAADGQWNEEEADDAPARLPLTSSTSEYVFGYNSVMAVLRSRRRTPFKLYVHENNESNKRKVKTRNDELTRVAQEAGVEIQRLGDDWLPLLHRAVEGKAHNGYVLEAGPVSTPLISSLETCSRDTKGPYYTVKLDHSDISKSRASTAKVRTMPFPENNTQHPLVIYCHGLTDAGNFGALLRSAYWFNVAGIVFPTRGSARPDSVSLKTSSGASEGLNLFTVADATAFLTSSAKAGWTLVVASPPRSERSTAASGSKQRQPTQSQPQQQVFQVPDETSQLAQLRRAGPVLLVLGGEEHGVPYHLEQLARHVVHIAGNHANELEVDSLNVSVAASLIMAEFAKSPSQEGTAKEEEEEEEEARENSIFPDDDAVALDEGEDVVPSIDEAAPREMEPDEMPEQKYSTG